MKLFTLCIFVRISSLFENKQKQNKQTTKKRIMDQDQNEHKNDERERERSIDIYIYRLMTNRYRNRNEEGCEDDRCRPLTVLPQITSVTSHLELI